MSISSTLPVCTSRCSLTFLVDPLNTCPFAPCFCRVLSLSSTIARVHLAFFFDSPCLPPQHFPFAHRLISDFPCRADPLNTCSFAACFYRVLSLSSRIARVHLAFFSDSPCLFPQHLHVCTSPYLRLSLSIPLKLARLQLAFVAYFPCRSPQQLPVCT